MSEEQKWYLECGTEVELIETCQRGFVVAVNYEESEDREPRFGPPRWVEKIYRSEAVVRMLPDIERRRAELLSLHAKIEERKKEAQQAEADYRQAMANFKNIEELRFLDQFLRGDIEYMVILNWRGEGMPEVVKFNDETRRQHDISLVVLEVHSNKTCHWQAKNWGDTYSRTIRLFPTRDLAVDFAASEVEKAWRKGVKDDRYYNALTRMGAAVPMEIQADYERRKQEAAERHRAAVAKKVAEAQAELAKLGGSEVSA